MIGRFDLGDFRVTCVECARGHHDHHHIHEASDGEPFDAQAVYKTLDPMMLAVLTEPNVNIPALLKTYSTDVNELLEFSS